MWIASSREKLDDLVERVVGLAIGGFDFGQGSGGLGRGALEQAVGKRAAHALVKEDEEQCGAGSFVGETVGITAAVALHQAVSFQLAQVVSQLGKRVAFGAECEAGKNGLMDIAGTPAQDSGAAMQQHLHQAQHAGIVEFDAWGFMLAGGNGQGQALEEGEIDVDVERLGLEGREAVGDGAEDSTHLVEMVEALGEPEIPEIVAERLQPQEGGKLLVHSHDRVLGIGAQHMMAMFGSLQHVAQLAADAFVQAPAEDLRDAVGAQAQQTQIAGALEQPVDGEVAPEDQVAAVLDLLDGVVTAEIDRMAVFFGELGTDD